MKLEILKYKLNNKKILNDKKIILLTDIHYSSRYNTKILDKIYNEINYIKPNYICIVGDLVDSTYEYEKLDIYKLIDFIRKLSKLCKVIISVGNHDVMKRVRMKWVYDYNDVWFNRIKKLNNVYLLDNSNYIVDDINFIGYTVPFNHYEEREKNNKYINESITNITRLESSNKYNILLSHSPIGIIDNNIIDNYLKNIDLILCGHTHGGLLPGFIKGNRGIISPYKKLFPKNIRGNINYKNLSVIISYGVIKLSSCTKVLKYFNIIFRKSIDIIELNSEK